MHMVNVSVNRRHCATTFRPTPGHSDVNATGLSCFQTTHDLLQAALEGVPWALGLAQEAGWIILTRRWIRPRRGRCVAYDPGTKVTGCAFSTLLPSRYGGCGGLGPVLTWYGRGTGGSLGRVPPCKPSLPPAPTLVPVAAPALSSRRDCTCAQGVSWVNAEK